jgi:endonuclease G
MLSNCVVFALIGVLAGGAARVFYPGREPRKILATVLLGMAGSLLGGLFSWAYWPAVEGHFSSGALLVSLLGAMVAIGLWAGVVHARTIAALKGNPMVTAAKHLSQPLLVLLLAVTPLAAQEPSPNVRFGMPSPARADSKQRDGYLIERPQYSLSYNAGTHTPNWVSWRLRQADIGKAERGPFEPDPLLPKGFAAVTTHVYDGSGFDRGHMCPAKDRSGSQPDEDATFYLTNVVPQSPASNQKGWEHLESYCRDLAEHGHVLYITCGPHGVGGSGKNGDKKEISKGHLEVTVPAKLWKVILVLPNEGAEPTKRTRVIAIIMPNDQTVGNDWAKYRVPVGDVEKLTGHHFFPALPKDVAAALKDRVDEVEIHVTPHKHEGTGKKVPE